MEAFPDWLDLFLIITGKAGEASLCDWSSRLPIIVRADRSVCKLAGVANQAAASSSSVVYVVS